MLWTNEIVGIFIAVLKRILKLSEILVPEESSYFFHNPWWILGLKMFCLDNISENVTEP